MKPIVLAALLFPAVLNAGRIQLDAATAVTDADRVYWDVPVGEIKSSDAALRVEFDCADRAALAAMPVTFHLKSGGGWLSSEYQGTLPASPLRLPFGSFTPEGAAGRPHDATALRVSLWRVKPENLPALAATVSAVPGANVRLVRATNRTAPGETGFAAAMEARAERLLSKAGVEYDTSTDDLRDLPASGVLVLPYAPKADVNLPALREFTRNGGRIVAFYVGEPGLCRLLGLRPGTYMNDPAGWSAFGDGKFCVPAPTQNLFPPRPAPDSGTETIAFWRNARGVQTRLPAVSSSKNGCVFAHVPPLATPDAVALMRRVCTGEWSSAPEKTMTPRELIDSIPAPRFWCDSASVPVPTNAVLFLAPRKTSAPKPKCAEIHLWFQCGCPVTAGQRKAKLAELLAEVEADPGIAGVQLDYVRTGDGVAQSAESTAAITEFVRQASRELRKRRPGLKLSAAVFPTPEAAAARNQDWPAWIRENLIDFACPMTYTEDPSEYKIMVGLCTAAAPPSKILPGVAVSADEAQCDGVIAAAEREAALAAGCPDVVFFRFDESFLH